MIIQRVLAQRFFFFKKFFFASDGSIFPADLFKDNKTSVTFSNDPLSFPFYLDTSPFLLENTLPLSLRVKEGLFILALSSTLESATYIPPCPLVPFPLNSGRTQVLYKARVSQFYCDLFSWSCFFFSGNC